MNNPMKSLRKRLTSAGIRKALLDKFVLPDWWDDEIATSPAGFAQGAMIIARHLNLPISSLMNSDADTLFSDLGSLKLKTRDNVQIEDIGEARLFISQLARITAQAMQKMPLNIPAESPANIREQLLQNGAPWFGLSQLLDYCWQLGIPVLYLSAPLNPQKPEGAAVMVDSRPVIIICRHTKDAVWMQFAIAHELGHIVMRHIVGNGMLVDEKVPEEGADDEELSAINYAWELLTGHPPLLVDEAKLSEAHVIAENSPQYGSKKDSLSGRTGHSIVFAVKSSKMRHYSYTNAVQKIIEPNADAPALIREKMEQQLPWDEISVESGEFIRRLTGSERCLAAAL
ncbi:MAG: hypothetical protein WCJ56_13845 [bacterium]